MIAALAILALVLGWLVVDLIFGWAEEPGRIVPGWRRR